MVKEFRNKEPLSEANLYTRELDGINGKKWELIKEVQNLWKTIYKLTEPRPWNMMSQKVLLEDHIVKTMAMKGPPFIAPFKHEILAWEAKLSCFLDSMKILHASGYEELGPYCRG
ncbi:unnamed protein product [Caretta caretta]